MVRRSYMLALRYHASEANKEGKKKEANMSCLISLPGSSVSVPVFACSSSSGMLTSKTN